MRVRTAGILDNPAIFAEQYKERRKVVKKLREIDALEGKLAGNGMGNGQAGATVDALSEDQLAKVQLKSRYQQELAWLEPAPTLPVADSGASSSSSGGISSSGGAIPDRLSLAVEYLDLVALHPVKHSSVVFHVRRICRDALTSFQLMGDLLKAQDLSQLRSIVLQCVAFQRDGNFVFDPDKERREAEALALKKRQESLRKAYEERMVRKAKREGRSLDHYLKQGAAPPTVKDVADMKALRDSGSDGQDRAQAQWRAKWPQHCSAFHLAPEGCKRDRRCAFLHVEAAGAAPTFDEQPSWLEENNAR